MPLVLVGHVFNLPRLLKAFPFFFFPSSCQNYAARQLHNSSLLQSLFLSGLNLNTTDALPKLYDLLDSVPLLQYLRLGLKFDNSSRMSFPIVATACTAFCRYYGSVLYFLWSDRESGIRDSRTRRTFSSALLPITWSGEAVRTCLT